MSEEVKCDCKEKAVKKVKEFLFISGSVFVGATLAILVSASLLKPKCPPPPMGMMPPRPCCERQLPPPPYAMHRHGCCPCKCRCHRGNRADFNNKNFPAPKNFEDKFPPQSEQNK